MIKINESTKLDIGPHDILIDKKNGRRYEVLKPYNGYTTLREVGSSHISSVVNDHFTTDYYEIED